MCFGPQLIFCNLVYSSVFREMKKYQKDFSSWCGECQREKKERHSQSVAATKLVVLPFFKKILNLLLSLKLAFFKAGGGSNT
ncbi:hypothetical protein BHE74_00013400 [Ensete ventricosum]|nr:hypothetical protein BHE74_00013400 [Ensete ventricosum]RZS04579.1 hypothetical protein BHM03_00034933 [Ensete ventricosum]